jgi:hypothetical protein
MPHDCFQLSAAPASTLQLQRWPAVVGQLLNEVAVLVGRPMPPPKQCFHTRIQILLQVDGFIIFKFKYPKTTSKSKI